MSVSSSNDAAEREYLSPREFVARSGLSLATVRRYLADGRLPSVQPGGRRCRMLIPVAALERFAAANKLITKTETPNTLAASKRSITSNKSLPGPRAKWRS
jgi:excisionase family DNA binding protein